MKHLTLIAGVILTVFHVKAQSDSPVGTREVLDFSRNNKFNIVDKYGNVIRPALKEAEMRKLLTDVPEAYVTYNAHLRNLKTKRLLVGGSIISGIAGAGLIIATKQNTTAKGMPRPSLFYPGIGLIALCPALFAFSVPSIILTRVRGSQTENLYNEKLYTLGFGPTLHGAGLVLRY